MNTKFKAALKMSTLTPDGKATKAEHVVTLMALATNYFPTANLPLPLANVTTAINNLHTAILTAAKGTVGSVSHMHETERVLVQLLSVLRAYVEMVANNSIDAKTIIEAAGMDAVKNGGGGTPVSELTITSLGNGAVQISVPRNTGEKAFIYQYSTDGGTTWLELDYSYLATITLRNQTPATVLHFRFAPISKTKGAYSQAKSGIVL
ncbi:MAG: hypothetical protein ABL940_09525 [Bacteroidia bacterium]